MTPGAAPRPNSRLKSNQVAQTNRYQSPKYDCFHQHQTLFRYKIPGSAPLSGSAPRLNRFFLGTMSNPFTKFHGNAAQWFLRNKLTGHRGETWWACEEDGWLSKKWWRANVISQLFGITDHIQTFHWPLSSGYEKCPVIYIWKIKDLHQHIMTLELCFCICYLGVLKIQKVQRFYSFCILDDNWFSVR